MLNVQRNPKAYLGRGEKEEGEGMEVDCVCVCVGGGGREVDYIPIVTLSPPE